MSIIKLETQSEVKEAGVARVEDSDKHELLSRLKSVKIRNNDLRDIIKQHEHELKMVTRKSDAHVK